jgi:hypothetical protein
MSDTAVQRRSQDLQAANLNPLLAVGNPASTPGIGTASLGNPGQAFGGLGQQVSSAAALNTQTAQINNTNADTALKNANAENVAADTDNKTGIGPIGQAQVTQMLSSAGLNNASLEEVQAKANQANTQSTLNAAQVNKVNADISNAISSNPGITAQSKISQLDFHSQQMIMSSLIDAAIQGNRASQSSAQAQQDYNNSFLGQVFHSLVGAQGSIGQSGFSLSHK